MTMHEALHDVVVAAPDGPAALALEHRLAHLCPVTISRDNSWVVELDGIDAPAEVEDAVRLWLAEIGSASALVRIDNRLVRIRQHHRRATHSDFVG
jgi:hypothetical protein